MALQVAFVTRTTLVALAVCAALPAGRAHAQAVAANVAAPKVAIVVVGDADARMRATAVRVEEALIAGGALTLASDLGLRAALRGEAAPAEDDGLGSVRRARRALGLGETEDAPNLARLGRMAGAALVVAVRADGRGGIELVTLQVAAAQFYAGALDAERSTAERIARAVERRATHAASATGTTTDARSEAATATATDAATATATEAATATDAATARRPRVGGRSTAQAANARRVRRTAPSAATAADAPEEEKTFLEKSWPYFVAGALLAGFVTYLVIDASSGNEPVQTPVLRFSPGP